MQPFSLDGSYSRRTSSRRSRFSVFFFIMFSFARRGLTGADNSDVLVAVYVGGRRCRLESRRYKGRGPPERKMQNPRPLRTRGRGTRKGNRDAEGARATSSRVFCGEEFEFFEGAGPIFG